MAIHIKPFDENVAHHNELASDSTADPRASSFMDALRARVNTQDEAQREKWVANAAPNRKRKPMLKRPDWMRQPEPDTKKPVKKAKQHPFANIGKRSKSS